MTKSTKKARKQAKSIPPPGKTYILFGADEYAKPRAAKFSAAKPELLTKAAETKV